MEKKAKWLFVTFFLAGIACALGFAGVVLARQPGASSSACIKCHTDLPLMDTYGAASGGGSAAIAG
ncbi:MAG: hypothetical protein M0Z58_00105 [Nitrospiraceae bacterium]|nr:hypothetical protein [Nitrospiraceae bacterium]